MATIIVEDGTGKADSNSYITESGLTAYATDRGISFSVSTAVLLIQAMDFIEQQSFKGDKLTGAQALVWPRGNVSLDGYAVATDSIPKLLADALCEVAMAIDVGSNPLATIGRAVKREKIDVIEVEYMDKAADQPWLTAAHAKLSKLIKSSNTAYRV